MMNFKKLAKQYKSSLLEDVIPFWMEHSIDQQHGGYLTCLNRDGSVFDTDKFTWLQARQVWTFSMLYNRIEKRKEWLEIANHGAEFLCEYAVDSQGNWYFALDRAGRPLTQPYNIFSDCFGAMAFAQFAKAAEDQTASNLAVQTYNNILTRLPNPKGSYEKQVAGSRPIKGFALPMILSNLTLELESLLPAETVQTQLDLATREVMQVFLNPQTNLISEHVSLTGTRIDSFDGRLINPGHGIEAMWFIMDIGQRSMDMTLINQAVDVTLATLNFGWDQTHGGIFYFLDQFGYPPQQLEWDQKLWWVHLETLIALVMGYALTGRPECLEWFQRVHQYTWDHFPTMSLGNGTAI